MGAQRSTGGMGMSKHRKAGHCPGNSHEAARALNRDADSGAEAKRKRKGKMYGSVRELFAGRKGK